MPLLIFGLAGLIAVVAMLRFSNIGFGRSLPRYLGMTLTGTAAIFFAVIERWVPAVFFASICWTIYTGGRALPRDWMEPGARDAPDDEPPRRGKVTMSRDEALKVLGLPPDAGEDAIRAAYRRLMQQNHPDKGGSDYLASKVNEAKDVLLGD
ncbi:MAG: DnaJ domain-containing protein [Alphaproteobacteria bacterium]|nr:DnaJ domain-containing protein [Alphaproteobacteria bacterium]